MKKRDAININILLADSLAGKYPLDEQLLNEYKEISDNLSKLSKLVHDIEQFSNTVSLGELEDAVIPSDTARYLYGVSLIRDKMLLLKNIAKNISEGKFESAQDNESSFSQTLNKMMEKLVANNNLMTAQKSTLTQLFNNIDPLILLNSENPSEILYHNKNADNHFGIKAGNLSILHHLRGITPREIPEIIHVPDFNRWYKITCSEMPWGISNAFCYFMVDVTAHKKREQDLENAANTDKLTGLYNRRAFDSFFELNWKQCSLKGKPISILMFDIDNFKRYNDTYGHLQGDKCLVAVADVLKDCIRREDDVIARFGGEEFAVILPTADRQIAMRIAEDIRFTIEQRTVSMVLATGELHATSFTVSGGVSSTTPTESVTPYSLIIAADSALYASKESGKNMISYADPYINMGDYE